MKYAWCILFTSLSLLLVVQVLILIQKPPAMTPVTLEYTEGLKVVDVAEKQIKDEVSVALKETYAKAVNDTLDCIAESMAFPRNMAFGVASVRCCGVLGVDRVLRQPVEKKK